MNGGCIVKVWFEANSPEQPKGARFTIIETEMPDFATFCEFVDADRLIGGAILWTRREGSTQIITKRRPIAFRGSTVMRCELPNFTYVEEEGE